MNDEASTSGSGALRLGTAGFVGLCLTTMSALMFEILVTRIFSVTMWYHFAFVAISQVTILGHPFFQCMTLALLSSPPSST